MTQKCCESFACARQFLSLMCPHLKTRAIMSLECMWHSRVVVVVGGGGGGKTLVLLPHLALARGGCNAEVVQVRGLCGICGCYTAAMQQAPAHWHPMPHPMWSLMFPHSCQTVNPACLVFLLLTVLPLKCFWLPHSVRGYFTSVFPDDC